MANIILTAKALMLDAKLMYLTNYEYIGQRIDYYDERSDFMIDCYISFRQEQYKNELKNGS